MFASLTHTQLPLPEWFDRDRVDQVWRVPYQERAAQAQAWQQQHQIRPAYLDQTRIALLAIDVQNTFCLPTFELFVAGRSGHGAVVDNRRLCEFIYRNLARITEITATLDTHKAHQIFHPAFWVNPTGQHPAPMTMISLAEVEAGQWRVNPALAAHLEQDNPATLNRYACHYVKTLSQEGKYPLTIWPYHAMEGGIGHALVAAVEEALFCHSLARSSPTPLETKGSHPLTENYSVLSPEVLTDAQGKAIATKNTPLIDRLLHFDVVIIAGQAKSHCVAWTVDDLLTEIQVIDPTLAGKIYLLEDCTSPVVVPGVVDFTEPADAAFARFQAAGIHVVQSTTPMDEWPERSKG